MSAIERRVEATDVAGMDACIRGLRVALEECEQRWARVQESADDLHLIRNEVEAITAHWAKIRGPLPEEPS